MKPWENPTVVGKPVPRVDGYDRAGGTAVYTMDVRLPGMLHGAILRCPHGHARVKSLDASEAAKMPGVRAIISVNDPEGAAPWAGNRSRVFETHCRYEGEEVAAVAADTQQQAWDAVRAIRVEYEVLPHVTDAAEALKADAPKVWDEGNEAGQPSRYSRGDIEKGFAEADAIVEETYSTPCQIHTPTELHGSVAQWRGGRLRVWDSTQGVFAIQQNLAQYFKIPLSDVRVIGHYMGGGFGSKLSLGKNTVIAAMLAKRTKRAVKLFVTREESFLCVGNRPPHTLTVKIGAKKDGTLTAIDYKGFGTSGAYPGRSTTDFQVRDLYTCPNVRTEERHVYVNAGSARPFRAPGYPQCSWALEQAMDALAEKIGMDPVELRLRNVPTVSQGNGNLPYATTGLAECLKKGAEAFGWQAARSRAKADGAIVRGVGVAAGLWGSAGGPPATAIVKLFLDGSANLNMGAADLGTGTKTVMTMIVSEELGVPVERISVEWADTGSTQPTGPSGGSKTVVSDGPPVRDAAAQVREKLLQMAAAQLNVPVAEVSLKDGKIAAGGKQLEFSQIRAFAQQQVVVGVASRAPNRTDKIQRPFAAQFAEVEVNKRTGEMKVLRMLGAQDSGRVMNLLTFRNQVYGGMVMGIGFGFTERRIFDSATGRIINANWHDYKLPTALDAPAEVACVPVEMIDDSTNLGAKGLGEPATIPSAAAVANALYNAIGVRITEAPASTSRIIEALNAKGNRG